MQKMAPIAHFFLPLPQCLLAACLECANREQVDTQHEAAPRRIQGRYAEE